ncbi:response regulator [Litoribacter populi]|uniref:response regulator n=1 Tax=Litoribacter populi TaxID=2598460 RepID=UPI002938D240|nr:response regulator [Litoribacter populi]
MMKDKKVLIVDDNALNRKVFENIIRHNYLFETAENGLVALDKLREKEFDIILMDIQMPKLDGISTLKVIKNEHLSEAPIIAVSAYSDQSDRDYFIATGFDEFIAKPIKPKNLLETIFQHLQPEGAISSHSTVQEEEVAPQEPEELNEKIVKQLLKYNTPDNIKTVYLDFIEEAEDLTSDIKNLIDSKNYKEIGEKLHIIKGNSGTLGANKIYHFSASFEKNIKTSNFDNISQEHLKLKQLLDNFRDYFSDKQSIL